MARLLPSIARILRDRSGATAVEFAIVAPLFFTVSFATFEIGWFYFVNSQVDAASLEASRIVRTGQAQESGFDKDEFFDAVCPKLAVMGDCDTRMTVEVDTFASFAALAADTSPTICADAAPEELAAIAYNPGLDNQIVRLRMCFIYDTINPTIGINIADTDGTKRKLYGGSIFRNEPFSRNARS
jgi:Flp pilus assembly protein TadG